MKRDDRFNLETAVEYYNELGNITEASRKHCEELGIEHGEMYRNALSRFIRKGTPSLKEEFEGYSFSAIGNDGRLLTIKEYCDFYGFEFDNIKSYKSVTHNGTPYYNILFHTKQEVEDKGQFFEKLLREIEELSTLPKTIKRDSLKQESHLLVVDPADIHIGKLCDSFETGDSYSNEIAFNRAISGVLGILDKAKGFPIEKILFIGGNDILHIDTPKRTTTSGTPQDTDGMWYSNFLLAKDLYIKILDILLEVADVEFVFNPSNHDYQSGFFLADVIKTYYKDCPNISFDCSIAHRKYTVYGDNLIGTTHGDGAKQADLPLLMASESPHWSSCKHRYIYSHHVHHKVAKDYIGVTFETLRSPSGTDSWHYRNGYTGVPKAVEGFIHHPKHGQIARFTNIF